jgi:hypothetical protein
MFLQKKTAFFFACAKAGLKTEKNQLRTREKRCQTSLPVLPASSETERKRSIAIITLVAPSILKQLHIGDFYCPWK